MNLEALRALFLEGVQNRVVYTPTFMDQPQTSYSHTIYPLRALNLLLDVLKGLSSCDSDEEDDFLTRCSVRFVVDLSGVIWFAREGETGRYVPSHIQMKHRCLAAGRLVFSEDYSKIVSITNDSGHFLPNKESLAWVVAVLIYNEAPLAERVTLGFRIRSNQFMESLFTPDELRAALPEGMNIEDIKRLNQRIETPELNEHGMKKRVWSFDEDTFCLPKRALGAVDNSSSEAVGGRRFNGFSLFQPIEQIHQGESIPVENQGYSTPT